MNAVLLTARIVATRAINFVVSMKGFGLNCRTLSRSFRAEPDTSGFSFEQNVAKELIAARISSIS